MSNVWEPADAGKVTDPSVNEAPGDPSILHVRERNVKTLVRMSAILMRLSARLDVSLSSR